MVFVTICSHEVITRQPLLLPIIHRLHLSRAHGLEQDANDGQRGGDAHAGRGKGEQGRRCSLLEEGGAGAVACALGGGREGMGGRERGRRWGRGSAGIQGGWGSGGAGSEGEGGGGASQDLGRRWGGRRGGGRGLAAKGSGGIDLVQDRRRSLEVFCGGSWTCSARMEGGDEGRPRSRAIGFFVAG